jgi:biopolymer transport protein ExbB/TolQ
MSPEKKGEQMTYRAAERAFEETVDALKDQALEELEEADEMFGDLIDKILHVEDLLRGGPAERLRQVRAQLETARNEDHEWLGRSMYTLASVMSEISGDDES